jgi:hypothetical protein
MVALATNRSASAQDPYDTTLLGEPAIGDIEMERAEVEVLP